MSLWRRIWLLWFRAPRWRRPSRAVPPPGLILQARAAGFCAAVSDWGYICDLTRDHQGQHIASIAPGKVVHRWR